MKAAIILFFLFLCASSFAQFSIGVGGGVARSQSINSTDEVFKNSHYEIGGMTWRDMELYFNYTFREKYSVGLGIGSTSLGFLTRSTEGITPRDFFPHYPPGHPIYFVSRRKGDYYKFPIRFGYQVSKKVNLTVGINCLVLKQPYALGQTKVYVIDLWENTWEERYEWESYDYRRVNFAAIASMKYEIWKGINFTLEYLRGIQTYNTNTNSVKLFHHGVIVSLGYEYTFKKSK